jgi:MFS family permease
MLLGSAFVGMGGYTTAGFTPAFLMRSHGMSLGDAGLQFGLAAGAASSVSLLLAGWIADRLSARDPRWLIGVVIAMIVVSLPLSVASFRITDSGSAIMALAVNQVIPIAYAAPITIALHRLAPIELRARMSALLLLSTGIAGGFGPLIAGAISDRLSAEYGQESLRHALDIIPVVYASAAICYAIAMTSFRAEITGDA